MAHLESISEGKIERIPLNFVPVTYLEDSGKGLEPISELTPNAVAAVYRSKRNIVLLNLRSSSLYVNQCKVALFRIVREGDQLQIDAYKVLFRELHKEVLTPDSSVVHQKLRCLVDAKPFQVGDSVVFCPSCGTPHHERCWQYQKGRCANGKVCQYQTPSAETEP
jgi:hypothetical protein